MNNNRKHYIKKERKGQIVFVLVILLAIIIGIAWAVIENEQEAQVWKPAAVYPMANAHISWEQTHYPGPWGVNDDAGT